MILMRETTPPIIRVVRIEAGQRPSVAIEVGELQPEDLGAQACLQLLRRTAGHDLTPVQYGDPVGELIGLLQVLGGEHDGDALGDQIAHRRPQLFPAARV